MTEPDLNFANETAGFNIVPFAGMAGGWLGPLLMFWLYVWGPLRPFHYADGDLLPSLPLGLAFIAIGIAMWWLASSFYQIRVMRPISCVAATSPDSGLFGTERMCALSCVALN